MVFKDLQGKIIRYLHGARFRGIGESNLKKISKNIKSMDDWIKRKKKIKAGILKAAGLTPFPKKTPINVVRHGIQQKDGFTIENLYFESIPRFYVTGNLYFPRRCIKHATVAILKPHGHFKSGRLRIDNHHLCATLARMGAIVFTYDMVGYCDSVQVRHDFPHALTIQLWNSIRCLDFICGLNEVDPKRIGITGASGGATQSFLLTAVDDRVQASALVVMVSAFFYGGCICESGLPIHRGEGYKTNNAEISAMCAPKPLLLVSVGSDWTRFVPCHEYPFIKSIYKLYDAESMVRNVHFPDEKHDLGYSKRQAVYEFFREHFSLAVDGIRDDQGIYNEGPNLPVNFEKMHAFNDDYP
ncbi:MAG: alpha/beta hydrolase family protein, partial [Promethearchaeota archaeon]